jgi:putative N6-adenine-specific DNA methylase
LGLFATAARGTEDVLAGELGALGMGGVRRAPGGVHFAGGLAEALRACLWLRTAQRVLVPLARFAAPDADALHAQARTVAWERFVTPRTTIAVSAASRAQAPLAHAPFLAQRLKDAICDRLREVAGARPDVDARNPDVRLYVHVESAARSRGGIPAVTVGVDPCGDGLHARGYRKAMTEAPLRETLAAAMLLLAGFDGRGPLRPLVDPMCGSGTIPIEAALIAARIAPGRAVPGRRFGFEPWPAFRDDAELRATWEKMCADADAGALAKAPVEIVGADRDPAALAAARANAKACVPAVAASITWREADCRALAPLSPPGLIVTNPPYGERLGRGGGLEPFWRAFGQRLRTLSGHQAFVLIPDGPARDWLAMRPRSQVPLMNGPLAVTLAGYEITARPAPAPDAPPPGPRR